MTVRKRSKSRKKLANVWDTYALDMLDCLDLKAEAGPALDAAGSVHSGSALFEEYVFFGTDQVIPGPSCERAVHICPGGLTGLTAAPFSFGTRRSCARPTRPPSPPSSAR